jgi:digeranylgeranylglycerophospholipid reductase
MEKYDVLIIGGGLAGLSAAFHASELSGGSLSVAVVERLEGAAYERYHRICGEGVSKRARKEIQPLPFNGVLHEIHELVENWPGHAPIVYKAEGYIVNRPELLKGIRQEATKSVSFIQDAVRSIQNEDGTYLSTLASGTSISSRFVVGADGAMSKVRTQLIPEHKRRLIWADRYLVDAPSEPHALHFYYDERYHGAYRWSFPCGDRTNMGFPQGCDVAPENSILHRRAIPFQRAGPLVKGNACLVGDAGALANPLTFAGIRTALLSGKLAAAAIVKGDLSSYERAWNRIGFSSPRFTDAFNALERMDNRQLAECMKFVGKKADVIGYLRSSLINRKYRVLFRAFPLTDRYGW